MVSGKCRWAAGGGRIHSSRGWMEGEESGADSLQTGTLRRHPVDLPDHQSLHKIGTL